MRTLTPSVRSIRVDLDGPAHELLLRVRRTLVDRNNARTSALKFGEYEPATAKAIIQRGIAAVAKDIGLETELTDNAI